MLPVMLDVRRLRIILVVDGAAAERRLLLLDEAGAEALAVHSERPSPALALAAGARLRRRLPTAEELAAARLVFIAERHAPCGVALARLARAAGTLVHVEDEPALSDLHLPAVLRRGDLTLAVSTAGRCPGLAVQVKRFLAGLFGPEWRGRLDQLAALRHGWRSDGADPETISRRTEEWVGRQGWLATEAGDAPPRGGRAVSQTSFAAMH